MDDELRRLKEETVRLQLEAGLLATKIAFELAALDHSRVMRASEMVVRDAGEARERGRGELGRTIRRVRRQHGRPGSSGKE